MDVTEVTMIHHVGVVFLLIWLLSSFNYCHPVVYFISFIYLFAVHDRYAMRFRRKVQFEERRQANQKRVLSDSESVRWLNHAIEKIWSVCMEEIVSQKILLPIVPWFLQKYKPWTVKDAVVQHLYLGRSPPMFSEMRVLHQSNNDDHLVLELGINFRTAEDMSAILAVKLTKRLGFGMWAKLHLTGMHVEGKVLVGVKFLHKWPFLGRLRVCFVEPPYFQMTVKPIFSHGLDVTELPGIAGWLDKLLSLAFEETLVEPNMLVVDIEKFVSPEAETWFSVDAKEHIAYSIVEVIEGANMKPADLNGLSDPYVKGQLGPYRFRTKTQKKTLSPKWQEEFKIPISTWESPNVLTIEVRDKDRFSVDDMLGECSVKINDLRDGQRHDMWLSLENIKMGRLHLAITVLEVDGKVTEQPHDWAALSNESKRNSFASDTANRDSFTSPSSQKSPKTADEFEPIDVEGQKETGIWVHHPGPEVPQIWEPRKGKNRSSDSSIKKGGDSVSSVIKSSSHSNDTSSTDESQECSKEKNPVKRGLHKIGSVFRRKDKEKSVSFNEKDSKSRDICDELVPSPHDNLRATDIKGIGVNFVVDENLRSPGVKDSNTEGTQSPERSQPESPSDKSNVKGMAKSIMKHAGRSARSMKHALSRKSSRKSDSGSVHTEGDLSVESDSSHDGSLPSPAPRPPQIKASSVVSDDNPVYVLGSNSPVPIYSGGPEAETVDPVSKVYVVDDSQVIGGKAVDDPESL